MSTDELKGTMAESVRQAKSRFMRIDTPAIQRFIEGQPDVSGPVSIEDVVFPTDGAGSSNGIAFLKATGNFGNSVQTLDLVLRYSPGEQLLKQKRYDHEFETLMALQPSGLPVPQALWLDADGHWLGAAGYIMKRVDGEVPSAAMYSAGPLANVAPDIRNELMLKAAGFHGRLRKAAIGPDKVPHLMNRGNGATPIRRELNWWLEEVNRVCEEDDPKAQTIKAVHNWMVRYEPTDLYPANLVHGDAQIANIIYAEGDIAAVVDWELSYLGHNESDLALICFLTESQKLTDTAVEGTPTEEEYLARYSRESGAEIMHWPYFKLFNLYKIIAVSRMSAHFMPSFEHLWSFYVQTLEDVWSAAKATYE
ncbi:MAG: hypothetical protein CVT79_04940 [Alphaproteobacteria bacterium HGW-Alphaproteobacteria-18]|nr:MAG: hypothetical protein CVT79_04940 [Alphaproteobacteria bacterium HGW-Alphaproteobacteria-18]